MSRTILLVDMNAFFISCEASRNPELKKVPAAVAGDPKNRSGIILAANYEARKFKVKTTMVIHEAKKLCPDLVLVPPDHKFYSKKSNEVMSILQRYTPVIQQNSIDEAWLDMTGCEALFGKPVEAAERIMKDIINELDLWCSIGISYNKFLAKMASEIKKPLGITEVWEKDLKSKIWTLPVSDMYGIGKRSSQRLTELAIYTIGDIANNNEVFLVSEFGKFGSEMYRLANGIDDSPVVPGTYGDCKSISRSTTLREDITDIETAKSVLLKLAEDVGADARKYDYKGKTVSIEIKYSDFKTITRQKSIQPTYLTRDIYKTGVELLTEYWNVQKPVRLLGIGLGKFDTDDSRQMSIFDTIEGTDKGIDNSLKEEKLEKAIDVLRQKYGKGKIKRAKNLE